MIDLSRKIKDKKTRDRASVLYRELNRNYLMMVKTYTAEYAKLEFSVQFKFQLQELKRVSGMSFYELMEGEE